MTKHWRNPLVVEQGWVALPLALAICLASCSSSPDDSAGRASDGTGGASDGTGGVAVAGSSSGVGATGAGGAGSGHISTGGSGSDVSGTGGAPGGPGLGGTGFGGAGSGGSGPDGAGLGGATAASGGAGSDQLGGSSAGGATTGLPSGGNAGSNPFAQGGAPGSGGTASSGGGQGSAASGGSAGGTGAEPGPDRGMTLYYVRHAETLANVTEDYSSLSYEEMDNFTPLGERQVSALTDYLLSTGLEPDAVLVSPTTRTQRTIAPFLVAANLTGVIWPELAECCDQTPTGGPLPTEPEFYEYFEISLESNNLEFREDGARALWKTDSYEAGLFMIMTARDSFLEQFSQSGSTVLLSGHAVAGSILMGLLLGEDMSEGPQDFQMRERLFMMNTGIQVLSQDPETGEFELLDTNVNSPEQG